MNKKKIKCAYWCSIKGLPQSLNTSTVRVTFPKSNVFSPETLNQLMINVANDGEVIIN